MRVLIVSATSLEVEPLVRFFRLREKQASNLQSYRYGDIDIDVLICGVGMVATTYWTGKVLSETDYDFAFNIGLAGSFDKSLPLGQVVNVYSDQFPEMGAESGEFFLSLVDLKLIEENRFPFKNGILLNETRIKSATCNQLKKVSGITVNTVHGHAASIEKLKKAHQPHVESMEGAAFMFVCKMEQVDFIQIRSLSNYVEPRNKDAWNIPLALDQLTKTLLSILNE